MTINIILPVYNRLSSLERLINSLLAAQIRGNMNLTISCEADSKEDVLAYVDKIQWSYGNFTVIQQPVKLGVDGHNIACMKMVEELGSALILEDDLVLSPYFQDYILACNDILKRERKLAGISLYRYPMVEVDHFPFELIPSDEFVYYQQRPCSKGTFYTWEMLQPYLQFLDNFDHNFEDYYLPDNVQKWGDEVWEKSFYCYLLASDMYLAFPRHSFTTDSGDSGVHMKNETNKYAHQSRLYLSANIGTIKLWNETENRYDSHYELLPDIFKTKVSMLSDLDFEVDLYGNKNLKNVHAPLVLSSKKCNKPIFGWERRMKPEVNNILMNQKGQFYSIGHKEDFSTEKHKETLKEKFLYYYPDTRLLDLVQMKFSEVFSRFIGK